MDQVNIYDPPGNCQLQSVLGKVKDALDWHITKTLKNRHVVSHTYS